MGTYLKPYFLFVLLGIQCCLCEVAVGQQESEAMKIFAEAERMRKSNNFLSSIDIYGKAIELDPLNPRFYFSKGLAYFKMKDYESSALTVQETARLKPDFVPAYTLIAQSYHELNQPKKVVEYMEKAFQYEVDEKKRMDYKMRIIENLFKTEEYDEALKQIIDVKYLAPNLTDVLYYEGAIYNQKGKHLQAKEILSNAILQLTTGDPRITAKYYFELGLAHYNLKEFEMAQEVFKKANVGPFRVKIAKMSPQYYSVAATCFLSINDMETAKDMLKKVLEIQDNLSEVHVMLSKIAQREADHSVAIDELLKAISIEQDKKKVTEIYFELVQLYLDNKKYSQAIETSQSYLELFPKDYNMMFLKGAGQYLSDDLRSAAFTMENVTKMQGIEIMLQFKFQFLLGLIYRDLGEDILAEQAFTKSSNAMYKQPSEIELFELKQQDDGYDAQ